MTATTDTAIVDDLCRLVLGRADPAGTDQAAWPALVRLAQQHGLASMLYYALRQQDALSALPRQAATELAALHAQIAGQNSLAYAALREWSLRFQEAGISALWLKGAALGLMVYPHPHLRDMGDIDVLVGPAQIAAARALVEQVTGRKTSSLASDVDRHATAKVGTGYQVNLELHWSLVDMTVNPGSEDIDWFLAQQLVIQSDGADVRTLSPEAHLLHLCAHAQIIHGDQFRLVRYLDLHLLITRYPALDWELIVERAAAFGWSYGVERALLLTQRYFATPLPPDLLAKLRGRRTEAENLARVTRHDAVDSRGAKLLSRVAWMPWRARIRYILAFAFPSPTYMRSRYKLAHTALSALRGWQVPLYYPYRWLDVAGEVVRTVMKRIGR